MIDDKEASLEELRRQFQNPDFPVDIVQWSVQKYEAEPGPKERELFLESWWNWALSERWAWDVLIELCRRTKFESKRPRILNDFANLVATEELKPPDKRPGHPVNDFNIDLDIFLTVRVLVKDYGFTKTAACKMVSEWSKTAGGIHREPDTIRKVVRKMETRTPFPRSRVARK